MVWVMRDYDSVEPIILSVPEHDEVSIADVAYMVAEAAGLPRERVRRGARESPPRPRFN